MDTVALQDFVALAEAGSFSRAAVRRNVTQPAFSRRIRALEEWVGTPLFERTSRGTRLTEAGEVFARSAGDLLHQMETLRARTRESGTDRARLLKFAATQTLSFTFFPEWLRSLGRIDLHLVQLNAANMADCREIMQQGAAHFLVCHSHPDAADPLRDQFRSVEIGADRLIAVHAPGLPLSSPNGGPLPYLAYDDPSGLGSVVEALEPDLPYVAARRTVFTSHLAAALRTLACDGEGMAWLPESLIRSDLADERLRRIAAPSFDIAVSIRLYRADRLSAAAETFWRSITNGKVDRFP